MMEKSHRCKLCFRNFANGRALGGHMRSHMMKFFAEKGAFKEEEEEGEEENPFDDDFQSVHSYSSPPTSSSSSSSDEDESEDVKALMSYELRENPKKSALLVDHEFSSLVPQDRESETESSKKNPICKRSKRVRKSRILDFNGFGFFQMKKAKFEGEGRRNSTNENSSMVEPEPLSSISDTTPEEHVARCLIMLSRDKWKRDEIKYQEDKEEKLGDDYSEDSGMMKVTKTKVRGKYRCEACNKLFKSYQALGGHRASHKKIKAAGKTEPKAATAVVAAAAVVEEKIHECPFCHRIFSSGQALGGHKRSHFIGGAVSANISTRSPVKQNSNTLKIDLNLPAPTDDDENSQIAVSAVSDAEFVHPIKQ
ncbi:hypothetical protein CDL12_06336 [Handroanthus impetiginosus]|uniref:C2H2-type domain-containing protein n=1 Tax=Handroanthus impetiginosus TaxID=429701 RepID=A0A2G9HTX8_9LAMI|nr:hypothetical protein CDL12_06336 [Handroanthus impetiginosus]